MTAHPIAVTRHPAAWTDEHESLRRLIEAMFGPGAAGEPTAETIRTVVYVEGPDGQPAGVTVIDEAAITGS